MRRLRLALAALAGLAVLYALAHGALIEVGREVVVLRTQERDGGWLETRVWIVDDAGTPTVHGADSQWMRNLKARPIVEMTRDGVTHRYRAVPVPGPHPHVHRLLRAKYGIADRWVRFVVPDDERAMPVRLERLPDR